VNISPINTVDRPDLVERMPAVSPTKETSPGSIPPDNSTIQAVKKAEEAPKSEEKLEMADAKEMVEALNEYMDVLQTNLGFSIREDLDHHPVVVEIKNRQTDELVKQIPSEELLAIMEKMKELNGIIFDQSV